MIFDALSKGKIRLLGSIVKVIQDDSIIEKDIMGMCDIHKNEILISASMNEDMQEETLIHEVIHYVSEKSQLNLSERQVMGLSTGLYAVIKDNEDIDMACEIISKINVMGGGVKFKCSDVKPIINNDGKFA